MTDYRPDKNVHVISLYPYRNAQPLNVRCDLDPWPSEKNSVHDTLS